MMSHPRLRRHEYRLFLLHRVCVKRGKFLESVPLESDLEARLVRLTFSERGREDSSVLGGAQVLLELAEPPIVDI
jgi:hypothetical protein